MSGRPILHGNSFGSESYFVMFIPKCVTKFCQWCDTTDWPIRLNHFYLKLVSVDRTLSTLPFCKVCTLNKDKHLPFHHRTYTARSPFEILHCDKASNTISVSLMIVLDSRGSSISCKIRLLFYFH